MTPEKKLSQAAVDNRPEINYPLVEDTRPAMYRAVKYWGKKPHNIWGQYIERYCPPNGIVLDPFVGSGITAFEAAKIGRKVYAFDLNPLSSFVIEVLSAPFDESKFLAGFSRIAIAIENDPVYQKHYTKLIGGRLATVFNYRWFAGKIVKVAAKVKYGKKTKTTFLAANRQDARKAKEMASIAIPYWVPGDRFPTTPSITHKFVKDVGGDQFKYLWTQRNLYLLSRIFHEIEQNSDAAVRKQLLFGFIQTLHLTCKMVYPRSTASQRDFSGSWGRSDYMIRRKQMEQNPLVVFTRSCIDKKGVLAALRDAKKTFPRGIKVSNIQTTKKIKSAAAINYGVLDVADLPNYVKKKSIDFIITDPPYGGLVKYLDLSLVWLTWLAKLDRKYKPDLQAEITVKEGQITREDYKRRLANAFKILHGVLKDDGRIVITFHHQKIREWNDFHAALRVSGFKYDKITHQYNKRSGESNVANPYGTSGADFYIRCVKRRDVDFTDDASGLNDFIIQKTIEIIARRNEPTPYDFIFAGLLPEMLQAGFIQPKDSVDELVKILSAQEGPGRIFLRTKNTTSKSGDFWWFQDPASHINYHDRPIKDRVEESILSLLRRKVSVKYDDILAELFRTYPNGLTPDIKAVKAILEKYAFRSAGNWKIRDSTIKESTEHTEIIRLLIEIGKKAGSRIYVGKREQPERCSPTEMLKDRCDLVGLAGLGCPYDAQQIERIEMIDAIWLEQTGAGIKCIFEVENTTDFMSAIQRASNLEKHVCKFMVVPDSRETKLRKIRDPLFLASFSKNNWRYLTYKSLRRLVGFSKPSVEEIIKIAKKLDV